MHDSEQEHSGITGCHVTYESTIFYNEANKFSIIVVKTSDPRIPPQACSGRYYGDRMLRFTAVGYELPRTKAVELELDGEWVESKYGYQLQVEQWQEIVPQTADGLLAYLGSGLIKGIGPKTAEDIVATFGPDTLNILDNEPEKLLQIRGITEGKLKDIEESYAESRVLRNLMSLLGPFKITPATALKIYQNFGPACVDILKKCPYDLCQISGFGFKRVDGIVRKTDNRLHSAERIKGAVLYTLEDARSKSGHLFLPSEDLVKETLLLLNAPIPIPEQRVRAEEVQETLQQMILHGAVVAYKQYLYSPRVFGQEDNTARMIAERLANISVHDRVMQTKNTEKVSNGDLGFITGITTNSKGERLVQMDFGGDRKMNYTPEQLAHVDLAYATTIHKAMGSEFETVIIPIVKAHTIMLYRNLLYTAVTRAKKKVILVGHKPILFMAVHRADISKRNTMLGERIRLYCKAYHTERNALPELQQAG